MHAPRAKFTPPWRDPQWRADAEAWIQRQASLQGLRITGTIESIHDRAWSTVLRVPTANGAIFFKAGGPTQSFEPALLAFLTGHFAEDTLPLIASDPVHGWSLMPDGGTTLRQATAGRADLSAWKIILRRYAQIQIGIATLRPQLLATGIPELPSSSLSSFFQKIVGDGSLNLVGSDEDHLTTDELHSLQDLAPTIAEMFAELDSFGVPLSLEHGDLHDANVFVREESYKIYDWGDAAYTHPFFTLLIPIRHLADKLGLSEYDPHPDLIAIRDAYLELWQAGFDRARLLAAWQLAHHLAKFARTINWYRVTTQIETGETDYATSVAGWLKEFLAHPTARF
jgi:hypothetical protein